MPDKCIYNDTKWQKMTWASGWEMLVLTSWTSNLTNRWLIKGKIWTIEIYSEWDWWLSFAVLAFCRHGLGPHIIYISYFLSLASVFSPPAVMLFTAIVTHHTVWEALQLQISIKLLEILTFNLWSSISVLMGVVLFKMTIHRAWGGHRWCESSQTTLPISITSMSIEEISFGKTAVPSLWSPSTRNNEAHQNCDEISVGFSLTPVCVGSAYIWRYCNDVVLTGHKAQ